MPKRSLVLKKETLVELTDDDMRAVVGAAPWTPSCPLFIELREKLSDVIC